MKKTLENNIFPKYHDQSHENFTTSKYYDSRSGEVMKTTGPPGNLSDTVRRYGANFLDCFYSPMFDQT